jgi:hypothetical protein
MAAGHQSARLIYEQGPTSGGPGRARTLATPCAFVRAAQSPVEEEVVRWGEGVIAVP